MKQFGLGSNLSTKRTRKCEFLEEMDRVVPWDVLVQIVSPYYAKAKTGRPAFAIETMLCAHYLKQWFGLSAPAVEETMLDVPVYHEFAKPDGVLDRLPDESTILRSSETFGFRQLLEKNNLAPDMLRAVNDLLGYKGLLLKTGTAVDVALINASGERDPEMHQTKKGNRWYFGVMAHIGVDADSGLVHSMITTPANVNDVTHCQCVAAWRGS